MSASIPMVKISHNTDPQRIRCPDCKMHALGFVDGHHMRTKDTVSFIMDSCRKPRRILFGNDRSQTDRDLQILLFVPSSKEAFNV